MYGHAHYRKRCERRSAWTDPSVIDGEGMAPPDTNFLLTQRYLFLQRNQIRASNFDASLPCSNVDTTKSMNTLVLAGSSVRFG